MKRYPAYKESGVEWLDIVPIHWKTIRMKYICTIETGAKDTVDREADGEYPFFVRSQVIERISSYSFDGEAILTAGDGVGVAKVFHYIDGKFDFHQRVYKFSDFNEVIGKFLFYYLKENLHKEVLKYNAKSTVDSLRLPFLQNFVIAKGELKEQSQIANFLDHKTSQIDDLIAQKQKLIELLKEERTALINNLVTKGLDPSVPLKHSGIEWLGELPVHWGLKRLKELVNHKLQYGANETGIEYNAAYPRYIRITDFDQDGSLRYDTLLSLDPQVAQNYLLNEGDILFARSGATVGKTFIYRESNGKACFAGYLIKATTILSVLSSDFLYYLTQSNYYENWKESIFSQSTIQNIGANKYEDFLVPLPSIDEQKEIALLIDDKSENIKSSIIKIQKEIELISEYKTSLINEAVTGKIDVRDYVI